MRRRPLLVIASCAVALLGCTEHTVGPARTLDDYVRKARTTAADARSTVETVRLVAEASGEGRTFGPYTGVSISEQEDRLAEIIGDFGSIQPPDDRADALREELDEILGTAIDDVAAVRIAARRGQLDALPTTAAPLEADSLALSAFLERNS